MYHHKIPEREKPDKEQYIIHRGELPTREEILGTGIVIASFDPATENFAYRVEYRGPTGIQTLSSYKLKLDHSVTFGRTPLYHQLTQVLETLAFREHIRMVVVERQMSCNYVAVRVSQHLLTYFMQIPSDKICVVELNPQVKTRALKCPKGLNKSAIKVWSGEKARELSTLRGDFQMLQLLDVNKKKDDDLADTVIQVEAFSVLLGLPTTQEIIHLRTAAGVGSAV